ncbi:PCYCGC motif-containing (lipo)protein [Radiobacillus sp. PE A8.2]|uniref:PCYCGC motif-containing (lipo)protein n=1 Tax=Radiobacillus sp. PE A8.2 TaxID=3380349 RepID=UPI003890EB97
MKKIFFLVITIAFITLVGCSDKEKSEESVINGPSDETVSMLSSKAKEVEIELPSFVTDRPSLVQENYALSYEYTDVLQYMPCFCGCVNQGHKSNYNCFIKEHNGKNVTWDKMGLNCDICNSIARESIALYEEGNSLYDIRTYIDDKFGSYGPSTKTPMPEKTM